MTTNTRKLNAGSDLAHTVASNIRGITAARGWTQGDLGRRIGLSTSAMSVRWREQREWGLGDLELVADALEVDPVDLFRNDLTPRRERDGGPVVRHQGLEPQTRWFAAYAPAAVAA